MSVSFAASRRHVLIRGLIAMGGSSGGSRWYFVHLGSRPYLERGPMALTAFDPELSKNCSTFVVSLRGCRFPPFLGSSLLVS